MTEKKDAHITIQQTDYGCKIEGSYSMAELCTMFARVIQITMSKSAVEQVDKAIKDAVDKGEYDMNDRAARAAYHFQMVQNTVQAMRAFISKIDDQVFDSQFYDALGILSQTGINPFLSASMHASSKDSGYSAMQTESYTHKAENKAMNSEEIDKINEDNPLETSITSKEDVDTEDAKPTKGFGLN